eukprot:4872952-Amphidinium_carterae.1
MPHRLRLSGKFSLPGHWPHAGKRTREVQKGQFPHGKHQAPERLQYKDGSFVGKLAASSNGAVSSSLAAWSR